LPEAASANKGIFFDAQTGQARTVADIYHSLASKIEKVASDLAGLASPSIPATPSMANEASIPSVPSSAGAVSSLGRKLDWSGTKLSGAILDMLSIVAMAALKLTGTERAATETPPTPSSQTRERRSV
jgi:hypothetical protein